MKIKKPQSNLSNRLENLTIITMLINAFLLSVPISPMFLGMVLPQVELIIGGVFSLLVVGFIFLYWDSVRKMTIEFLIKKMKRKPTLTDEIKISEETTEVAEGVSIHALASFVFLAIYIWESWNIGVVYNSLAAQRMAFIYLIVQIVLVGLMWFAHSEARRKFIKTILSIGDKYGNRNRKRKR